MAKTKNVLTKKEVLKHLGKTQKQLDDEIEKVLSATDEEFAEMSKDYQDDIKALSARAKSPSQLIAELNARSKRTRNVSKNAKRR